MRIGCFVMKDFHLEIQGWLGNCSACSEETRPSPAILAQDCNFLIGFIRESECVNVAMLALYFLVSYISEGGAFGIWRGVAGSEQQGGTQGTKAKRKPIVVHFGLFSEIHCIHWSQGVYCKFTGQPCVFWRNNVSYCYSCS